MPTNSPPGATPSKPPAASGRKTVRKRLADGSVKTYVYARKPKRPSRFHELNGGAIRELARGYTASPEFAALAQSWQTATRYYLGIVEDALLWMGFDELADPRARDEFYKLRDAHASTPTKADKIVGVLCTLLGWALERRRIPVNHATGIKRLVRGGDRAAKTWSDAQLAALLAVCPPDLSRLVRLALLTAARLGDLRSLTWGQIDGAGGAGTWLGFVPAKTSRMVPAPVVRLPVHELPPLAALLDECRAAHAPDAPAPAAPILATDARGIAWSTPNFNAKWKEALAKAGLLDADRHFHDLRGTAITRLLEAGCSDAETAAISGHSIGGRSQLRAYAARTDALAVSAYRKLNLWLADRPVVIPFARVK